MIDNNQAVRVAPIAAVVLCFNEQVNIRDCLESVKGWASIFVVDSGSTDRTVAICREYTDQIHTHAYANHADQWQWALDNLPIDAEWILALDADFVVSAELRQQIEREVPKLASDIDGVYVRHRYVFGGGAIRFGGTKQFWLRLIRRGYALPDLSDLVDFRFNVQRRTAQCLALAVRPTTRLLPLEATPPAIAAPGSPWWPPRVRAGPSTSTAPSKATASTPPTSIQPWAPWSYNSPTPLPIPGPTAKN